MVSKANRRRHLPVILLTAAVSLLGVGAFAVVRGILNSAPGQPKQVIQEIHLMRPPPPPPDLPPPPPPPPEEKVQVQEKPPEAKPSDQPPPGERLGLDAAGGAGSDAFGLVGNQGGRDLLAGGGSAFVWYAGLLKDRILDQLNADKAARQGQYSLLVRIWVRDDGSIDHVRIVQGSGDAGRDQAIEAALARLPRLVQGPPADMPEPISLKIVSRG
ncbi:MAG: TonB C-terminal domain-containing protein [Steroidobacteraceae bacterium]